MPIFILLSVQLWRIHPEMKCTSSILDIAYKIIVKSWHMSCGTFYLPSFFSFWAGEAWIGRFMSHYHSLKSMNIVHSQCRSWIAWEAHHLSSAYTMHCCWSSVVPSLALCGHLRRSSLLTATMISLKRSLLALCIRFKSPHSSYLTILFSWAN